MALPYEKVVVVVVALYGAVEAEWMNFEMLQRFVILDHLNHQQIETETSIASVCFAPQPVVAEVGAAAAAAQLTHVFSN